MAAKRVDIIRLEKVKESSFLYQERVISSPQTAANLFRAQLEVRDRECFMVAYLSTKYEPIALEVISIGTLNASLVHPREVFKGALLSNSATIMLGHNHPSGLVEPSPEDRAITKRLQEAGMILGIEVLDHIIIGSKGRYLSFKESGYLTL